MPTSIADLFVTVGSDVSGAVGGLALVDGGVQKAASAMDAAVPAALALGAAATVVGTGFATSVTVAADFEHQINGIKAVMSPAEVLQFGDAVSDLAVKLGKDTVFSASQAAQGIEEMIKAGVPLPAILGGAAAAALDLAAATGVPVAQAATLASTAMNTYHNSAAQLPAIMDAISNISNSTAISVGGLQLALQAVGPVAAGIGLSFQDTATALGIFANNGLIGSDAGTSLKTMLLNLEPTTKAQIAAFDTLGITTGGTANKFFDATGAARPMSEIFQVLKESTAGLTAEQKINLLQTAFGTDAVRAATIAASEGAAGWDAVTASMDKMGGTQVAATQRMAGLQGALNQLGGSFEAIQITVGTFFLPVLTQLALLAGDVLDAFSDLDPALQATIVAVVGVAGAAAGLVAAWVLIGPMVGSVVVAFGPLLASLAPLVLGLKLLSDAGTILYQAWQTDFGGIRELVATVWPAVQAFLNSFSGGLDLLKEAMTALASGDFTGFLTKVEAAIQSFANAFGPAMATLAPVVMSALGQLASAVADWVATTGLPQLGAWATAFIEWIGPAIPAMLARLGELASAVFTWVSTVGVPNLLAWASAFIEWIGPMIPPLLAELGKIASAVFTWVATVGVPNLLIWARAFIDWVIPMIPPLIAELGKILTAVVGFITAALPGLIQAVLEWATAFLSWVAPLIPPLLLELGNILVAIAGWILGTALPTIVPLVLQWATAFLTWIAPLIPPLLLQLAQLLAVIAGWIVGTALPILVDQVLLWAGPFLNFVLAVIPPLLLQLAQLLASIVIWIVGTALPQIVNAVLQWGTAFLGWIVPIIPQLLLQLAQMGAAIANWIIGTALPMLVQQVYSWGPVFINWIGATIPPMLTELARIGVAMAGWIVGTALPMITGYVLQWAGPFLAWIVPLIPPMLLQLAQLLSAIAAWIVNTALPILANEVLKWGVTFIDWIGETIPLLAPALGGFLLALANWIIADALPEIARLTIQWVGPFLSWIKDEVIPQLGPALAGLLKFIGDQLAYLPGIIVSVIGDPWAPFVAGTYNLGARIAGAIGNLAGIVADNIGPALLVVANIAATLESFFLGLPEPVQNVILAVAGIGAAFVALSPVITAAAGVITGVVGPLALIFSPVGLAITGMIAVAALLYAAWQDNFGGIQQVTAEVWAAIQPAFQNILDFINMLRDKLAPMFADAQGSAAPFIEQMSQALTPILAQLPGLVRAIGDAFNYMRPAFDSIGAVAEIVGQAISFLITGNLDRLVELMQEGLPQPFAAGLQLLHDIFATSLQVAGDLLGGIKTFIDYLKAGDVQGAFNSLVATFGTIKDRIQPLWNEFLQVVGNLLAALPGFIGNAVSGLWQFLVGVWSTLPGLVQPVWESIKTSLGGLMSQLPGALVTAAGAIWQYLIGVFSTLPGLAQPVWESVKESLGGLMSQLPGALVAAAGAIWQYVVGVFSTLPGLVNEIWPGILSNLGGLLSQIPGALAAAAGNIWQYVVGTFSTLPGLVNELWPGILSNIGGLMQTIAGALAAAAGNVWQYVVGVFSTLPGLVNEIWPGMMESLGGLMGTIAGGLATAAGNVWQYLVGTFSTLPGLVSEIWPGMINSLAGLLSTLPGALAEAAGDVWGWLGTALQNVVTKLKEILGPLVQAVKDLFAPIPEAFWTLFGGTGTGGTTGGTGGTLPPAGTTGALINIENVYVTDEASRQAFFADMANYIAESTGRVSATMTASLPAGA